MSVFKAILEKIGKLKNHSLHEILSIVFKSYIYRVIRMKEYGVIACESRSPDADCPYEIEFWGPDKYYDIIPKDPYLSLKEVDDFKELESICIVAIDKGKVIASIWMVPGRCIYPYREFGHKIEIGKGKYLGRRAFVHPDYRGQHVIGHMAHNFVETYNLKNERLYGIWFEWNIRSIKAFKRIGWKYGGDISFTTFLGFKWCRHRGTERNVVY